MNRLTSCRNGLFQAALAYNKKGLSIIPLHNMGKRPLIGWAEYQTSTATESEVSDWWKKWPDANIGISSIKFIIHYHRDHSSWPHLRSESIHLLQKS